MNRFKVTFADNSTFTLFGEEYFADKAIFFKAHQSNLEWFQKVVKEKGRPVKVRDIQENVSMLFESEKDFDAWYVENQSKTIDF